jgi:hypothetical protein
MAALNRNFTKWLIIISVLIGLVLIMVLFIKLLPFILILLVGLWIYSKLTKFSFRKRKEKQRKAEENEFTNSNNRPVNMEYTDAVEIDKDKVIDVEFVEEKKED